MVKFFPSDAKFRPDCCFWLTRDKKSHRRGRGGEMMSEDGGSSTGDPTPQPATTPSSQNHLALTPFQPGRPVKHHEHVPLCRREAREESWLQKTDCGNWTESIFIEPPTECLDRLNCLGSYKSLSADCVRSQSHPLCVISWGAGRYLSPAMLNERISLVWSEQMRFWALVGQLGGIQLSRLSSVALTDYAVVFI